MPDNVLDVWIPRKTKDGDEIPHYGDCPFELYASRMQHEDSLMIKTYELEHKCTRVFDNSMISAKYFTKLFMERIKLNTGWKTESLAQTMTSEVRVWVSKQMAYRVKKAALLVLEGTIMEQYARLRDYGIELKRVDPSTTVDIKCDFSNLRSFQSLGGWLELF
ncbi:hypothetical protein ABKV19_006656 [Rosa sericea]